MKRTIAMTGATGSMGSYTVREFLNGNMDGIVLRLLVRDSGKNRRLVRKWQSKGDVEVVWGDLLDKTTIGRLVAGADVVLHMGGMVSPSADYFPEKTFRTNVGGARNIVEAIHEAGQDETTRLVYIGSVSQYGPREVPNHWGGPGDHLGASAFDKYAESKIAAERIVAESGIKRWVSLRQSGILSPQTLMKGSDPITFHVPINGVLEWATVEDSARLMVAVSNPDVSENIWGRFFDIGSGHSFRLTNYQFECMLLKALGCPPPEKCFNPDWFATGNFHGIWYIDSDELESLVPFRRNVPAEKYFDELKASLPWYFKMAPLAPAFLIKAAMKMIASHKELGTLSWGKDKTGERWKAFFGDKIPERNWNKAVAPAPDREEGHPVLAEIGFDRHKRLEDLTIDDMKGIAASHGGECLSKEMPQNKGRLKFKRPDGSIFEALPNTVAFGGHF